MPYKKGDPVLFLKNIKNKMLRIIDYATWFNSITGNKIYFFYIIAKKRSMRINSFLFFCRIVLVFCLCDAVFIQHGIGENSSLVEYLSFNESSNQEPIKRIYEENITPTPISIVTSTALKNNAKSKVLLLNVDGRNNIISYIIYNTLILSEAKVDFVNLEVDGKASTLISNNTYSQIWYIDLSNSYTNFYPKDWDSIRSWFHSLPAKNVICDSRMSTPYWKEHYWAEGIQLTSNYYYNLLMRGGGLVLATNNDNYYFGINKLNDRIGLIPFKGGFDSKEIEMNLAVDAGNPLMITPNYMGESIHNVSSPGQSPHGVQPNGLVLYTIAWNADNIDAPAITTTITSDHYFSTTQSAASQIPKGFSHLTPTIPDYSASSKVLLINVDGRSYNYDSTNLHYTLLKAGADADYINLEFDGQAEKLISDNNYYQIWLFDLSFAPNDFPSDWNAIANWFRDHPSKNMICDSRMLASYRKGTYKEEGRKLTENYFVNLLLEGGGLLLATDHNDYHTGINEAAKLIGIDNFSGCFDPKGAWESIPIDPKNPLMNFPNDLGESLTNNTSPGQSPNGLQPNGIILYSAAGHSGDFDAPGISSTFEGEIGFHVHIISPDGNNTFNSNSPIHFDVIQKGGIPPISYSWQSDIDGYLSDAKSLTSLSLSKGKHKITVLAYDARGRIDNDSIRINIIEFHPTITNPISKMFTWTPTIPAMNPFQSTPTLTYFPTMLYTPTLTPTLSSTSIQTTTFALNPTIPNTAPTFPFTPTPTVMPAFTPSFTPTPSPFMNADESTPLSTHPSSPTFTQTMIPLISHLCTNNFSLIQYQIYSFDEKPRDLIIDDFNHDGYSDILTAIPNNKELILLLLQYPYDIIKDEIHIPLQFEPEFIQCGDLNGDGFKDIITLSYIDGRFEILFGETDALYSHREAYQIPFFDIQPILYFGKVQPMICLDCDKDNKDELYILEPDNFQNLCLVKRYSYHDFGDNYNVVNLKFDQFYSQDIQSIDFANLDFDENLELLLFTCNAPSLIIYKLDSKQIYRKWFEYSLEDTLLGNQMSSFAYSDATNDNLDDVFIIPFDGAIRFLSINNENNLHPSIIGNLGLKSIHDDILVTDLDRDGQKDILVAGRQKSGGDSFEELSVVCGENVGEFMDVMTFNTDRRSGLESLMLRSIDFNHDGIDDIVILDPFHKQLFFLENLSFNHNPLTPPTSKITKIIEWFFY
ncbi:MAG: hypothetical protein JXR73_01270 [Candidatus Omnitrophica bacterium]|nr:hypothetical protein [Candidatus Omnitrophota bacterium]